MNVKDIWVELRNELLQQFLAEGKNDKQKQLYLYVAQLNLLTSNEEIVVASKLPPFIKHEIFRIACELKAKNPEFLENNKASLESTLARVTRNLMVDYEAEQQLEFVNI